jgi:hypothetical protein
MEFEGGMAQGIAGSDEIGDAVFLTCIACGQIEMVHVPSESKLPPKVYWECLDCLKDEPRMA